MRRTRRVVTDSQQSEIASSGQPIEQSANAIYGIDDTLFLRGLERHMTAKIAFYKKRLEEQKAEAVDRTQRAARERRELCDKYYEAVFAVNNKASKKSQSNGQSAMYQSAMAKRKRSSDRDPSYDPSESVPESVPDRNSSKSISHNDFLSAYDNCLVKRSTEDDYDLAQLDISQVSTRLLDSVRADKNKVLFEMLRERGEFVLNQRRNNKRKWSEDISRAIYNLTKLAKTGGYVGSLIATIKPLVDYMKLLGSGAAENEKDKTDVNQMYQLNVAVLGQPGTGKTTFAERYANFLVACGFVFGRGDDVSNLKELQYQDVIGRYVGETGAIAQQAMMEELERVIFFDEAYSLTSVEQYSGDFIRELLLHTTTYSGHCSVVVAGYKDKMKSDFFDKNPGLKRRLPQELNIKCPVNETRSAYQELQSRVQFVGFHISPGNMAVLKAIGPDIELSQCQTDLAKIITHIRDDALLTDVLVKLVFGELVLAEIFGLKYVFENLPDDDANSLHEVVETYKLHTTADGYGKRYDIAGKSLYLDLSARNQQVRAVSWMFKEMVTLI